MVGLFLSCALLSFPANEPALPCGFTTLGSRTFPSFHRLPGELQPAGIDGVVNRAHQKQSTCRARAPRRPQKHKTLSAASPRPHDSRGSRRDGGHSETRPRAKLTVPMRPVPGFGSGWFLPLWTGRFFRRRYFRTMRS